MLVQPYKYMGGVSSSPVCFCLCVCVPPPYLELLLLEAGAVVSRLQIRVSPDELKC